MAEMYDLSSVAVQRMADAFEHGDIGELTEAQRNTIAFALRAVSKPDWLDGFAACAYLLTQQRDKYERLRDAFLAG